MSSSRVQIRFPGTPIALSGGINLLDGLVCLDMDPHYLAFDPSGHLC